MNLTFCCVYIQGIFTHEYQNSFLGLDKRKKMLTPHRNSCRERNFVIGWDNFFAAHSKNYMFSWLQEKETFLKSQQPILILPHCYYCCCGRKWRQKQALKNHSFTVTQIAPYIKVAVVKGALFYRPDFFVQTWFESRESGPNMRGLSYYFSSTENPDINSPAFWDNFFRLTL